MTTFADKVVLGKSGLRVSRLGVGSSYGVSPRACWKAFDAGVNYFFWGSTRTSGMGAAIRDMARAHRDELVVVLECYARYPWMIRRSVENGLRSLGVEQADVVLLGWHDDMPAERVIETASRLKEQGRFRCLGISSHQRPLFARFLRDGHFDVFHVRYNAAHPGAERDIFPHLPGDGEGPGVVSFTNTRWGDLLRARNMPPGTEPPSALDCYRFVLSNPHVHVAITGPRSDAELDHALELLRSGPMDEEELARMRVIGEHVHGVKSMMSVLS